MRTLGLAVFVSGVTVVMAGLFLIDSKTMRSMAIGAIVVVAIAVLAAMTLLPVLITRSGARVRAGPRCAACAGSSPPRPRACRMT